MGVEEVHVPTSKHKIDPKKVGEKGEKDADYWKDKKDAARAQREYMEETQTMEDLSKGKKKDEEIVKPVFQLKGGIDLGTIDLQAEREEAKKKLEEMKKEQDEQLKQVGQMNEQLRDKIHEQEIKYLQLTFKQQIDTIAKLLESDRATKKTFVEQYTEAMETAKTLGLHEAPQSGSLEIQLQLKKIEFEQSVALRKLAREEKGEERKWQLELRRLDDERKGKEEELAQQRKRDEMFAKAPEMIGRAIASGLAGGESAPPGQQAARGQGHFIEANVGDSGETDCPECYGKMAIGPTARSAVCPGCGLKVPIHRVEKKPSKLAEASAEESEEE